MSRWVIGLYGDVNYNEIIRHAYDLDNVIVVPIPELRFDKGQVVMIGHGNGGCICPKLKFKKGITDLVSFSFLT